MTETWVSPKTHLNLNVKGYCVEHLYGNKSARTNKGRHSGGISIYYKQNLRDKIEIIEKLQQGILWLKICKSMFQFDADVYLCCTYIPPRQSRLTNQNDVDFFENIEQGVEKYQLLGKVFLTGHLNSRTSNAPDFIEFDQFLDDYSVIQSNRNILPRTNKDTVLDANGIRLINFCISTNLLIANGRLHDDKSIGQFTYVGNYGMSVVDYVLSSQNDFKYINVFKIVSPTDLSDHCALNFCFK